MGRPRGSKNKHYKQPVAEKAEVADSQTPEAHVKVVSTTGVTVPSQKALLDQIAQLQAEKEALQGEVKRTQKEKQALIEVQAQGQIFGIAATERATGNQIMVRRLEKMKVVGWDSGREIMRPVFHQVPRDTYLYKVDMAPCGDIALKINGIPFYHGAVYELDIDTLRTVKDLVARTWDHDRQTSLASRTENFYRKKHEHWDPRNVISMRGG